jgi:hypothetical protein
MTAEARSAAAPRPGEVIAALINADPSTADQMHGEAVAR